MRTRSLQRGPRLLIKRLQDIEETGFCRLPRYGDDLRAGIEKSHARDQPEIPVCEEVHDAATSVQQQQCRHQQRLAARAVVCRQDEGILCRPDVLETVDGDNVARGEQSQRSQQQAVTQTEMRQGEAQNCACRQGLRAVVAGLGNGAKVWRCIGSSHAAGLGQRVARQARLTLPATYAWLWLQHDEALTTIGWQRRSGNSSTHLNRSCNPCLQYGCRLGLPASACESRAADDEQQMRWVILISSTTRAVLARIGWSRIGLAASLMLLAAALGMLCHMLGDVGIDKVVAAVRATPLQAVFVACAFVFIGYCTLTLYDYFALRAVGRCEVPYTVAAFAGFTAYAIGHGLGIGVLSGGAVRLRVYSHWGLGLIEVTKIGFITGLTFWLGNIFALGFAMAIAPSSAVAATRLPAWANQVLGLIALAGIAGYLAWLLPRTRNIGAGNVRVTLPSASQTIVQVAIGVVDLAVGTIATYVLLPATPATDYLTVALAYVMAALFGFLCHAPGSLGVFEVAMLVLLPQYQKDELLGSLLILHFLYLVLPLAIALLMLAVREVQLMRRRSSRAEASVGLP